MDRDLRWSFERAMSRLFPDPDTWEMSPKLLGILTFVVGAVLLLAFYT